MPVWARILFAESNFLSLRRNLNFTYGVKTAKIHFAQTGKFWRFYMFRKSIFVFLLLIAACAVAAFAQQTTDRREIRADRIFNFVFDGEGGYLGIQTQEVTRENFSKFGLSKVQGVAIDKVLENSPAARAGLQKGDVILKFDGEEVSSVRKLSRLMTEVAPDHEATLVVSRGGAEREIGVTLGKRPANSFEMGRFGMGIPLPNGQLSRLPMPNGVPQMRRLPPVYDGDDDSPILVLRSGSNRQIGVGVAPLTKQLAEYFGVEQNKGLLISSVRENSPAARAGLKAGDVIVEIDGKEMKGEIDLFRAINDKQEGDVSLTIIRDKNRQTIMVTPEISKEEFR